MQEGDQSEPVFPASAWSQRTEMGGLGKGGVVKGLAQAGGLFGSTKGRVDEKIMLLACSCLHVSC